MRQNYRPIQSSSFRVDFEWHEVEKSTVGVKSEYDEVWVNLIKSLKNRRWYLHERKWIIEKSEVYALLNNCLQHQNLNNLAGTFRVYGKLVTYPPFMTWVNRPGQDTFNYSGIRHAQVNTRQLLAFDSDFLQNNPLIKIRPIEIQTQIHSALPPEILAKYFFGSTYPELDGEELKKKYREKAREFHPDVNKREAKANEEFLALQVAYKFVQNKERIRRIAVFSKLAGEEVEDKFGFR